MSFDVQTQRSLPRGKILEGKILRNILFAPNASEFVNFFWLIATAKVHKFKIWILSVLIKSHLLQ